MASLFALYALPSDDVVSAIASVLSFNGSIDATYGVAKTKDGNPASRMRVNATSGRFIVDQGSAVTVRGVALINTKLAGATVTFEGADTDSWPGPSTTGIVINGAHPDGFEISPFKDITTTPFTRRWLSVNVTAAPNPWGIGEIWIVKNWRAWPAEMSPDTDKEYKRAGVTHPTDHGIGLHHDRGTYDNTFGFSMICTGAERDEIENIYRSVRGSSRGFLLVREKTVNDVRYVKFAPGTSIPERRRSQQTYMIRIVLKELGFGLVM